MKSNSMRTLKTGIGIVLTSLAVAAALPAAAQLPPPNEAGVSTGHIHLTVPDREKHFQIWQRLGGTAASSDPGGRIAFPGMYILLTEGEPAAPSSATVANHIGFSVNDYGAYKAALEAVGANIIVDNSDAGQIIADLPDGVRVELLTDAEQDQPIVFHHIHLVAADTVALRDWYTQVLVAEVGERRGLPSAIVPGGRVDVMPGRGEPPRGSRGAAIDHIGFDVADMDAFAARMQRLGFAFDIEPRRVESIGLTIAFITDPAGTFIEITEGLADLD